jgi:hypothetical protein
LDDAAASRVAGHLRRCPDCRHDFDQALDLLGELAAVPPPPDWVRSAVLWRASDAAASPDAPDLGADFDADFDADFGAAPTAAPPAPGRHGLTPFGKPLPRLAMIAASAAVMLVGSLAAWNYELRHGIDQQDRIYALVSNPAAAHPLQDSDLSAAVAGVVFAEPHGHEAYLVASGLPQLPTDQRYQVWLFTEQGTRVSAGLLSVGADGDARSLFETPSPFGDYIAVALTAEPQAGSPAPTSELALGGSFSN